MARKISLPFSQRRVAQQRLDIVPNREPVRSKNSTSKLMQTAIRQYDQWPELRTKETEGRGKRTFQNFDEQTDENGDSSAASMACKTHS